jgi:hypothetical protein
MRSYVAIVLIVCGTVLAAAPIVSDVVQATQVSEYLTKLGSAAGRQFFRQPLEESYRLGCWILGGAMISLGIIGGCRPRTNVERYRDREDTIFARAAG